MTTLFSGNVSFPQGAFDTPTVVVSNNLNNIEIDFNADPFPTGTTSVDIFLSNDGGNTFPFHAGSTFIAPHDFGTRFAHVFRMSFSVQDFNPNRAKATVDSPAAFTTHVTILAS